eukprot:scaffold8234_cov116-Skeletonema_marinoi.AAC.2
MHFILCVGFSSIVTWYVCELHEWKVDRIQAPASAIISEFEVGATTAIFLAYRLNAQISISLSLSSSVD